MHGASFSSLSTKALVCQVVALKPDWGKGYSRLGAAHHGLQNLKEAVGAYEKGQLNTWMVLWLLPGCNPLNATVQAHAHRR